MPPTFGQAASLERELLRKALFALDAGECRCIDCRRTPLAGERVHVYDDGRVVCELCRPNRREEPIRCERVHGHERGHAVRPVVRAA
jgi:hypothetical protein